jgi:hypothetical protein
MTTFPVAKLRKSTINKMVKECESMRTCAAIVYNTHIGRMLLISDVDKVNLPGYWWCLDRRSLKAMSVKGMADTRTSAGEIDDDDRPYSAKKYVICEIQMVDDRCENHVDKNVWKRLNKLRTGC